MQPAAGITSVFSIVLVMLQFSVNRSDTVLCGIRACRHLLVIFKPPNISSLEISGLPGEFDRLRQLFTSIRNLRNYLNDSEAGAQSAALF